MQYLIVSIINSDVVTSLIRLLLLLPNYVILIKPMSVRVLYAMPIENAADDSRAGGPTALIQYRT